MEYNTLLTHGVISMGVYYMEEKIIVKTFGGFSMTYGDRTISDQDNRSKKLWVILEYMIAFHDRSVPQSTIIDLIWNEDSSSSDPENALKTSLHRVRAMIDELKLPGKSIASKQGTYSWNNSLPCVFDFEEFISLVNRAGVSGVSDEERMECYRQASELYKGDFLPKCQTEVWASGLATRYRAIYVKMINQYIRLLLEKAMYEEAVGCCSAALSIEPMDEEINYNFIYALNKTGNQQAAVDNYNRIVSMYYAEFGVEPGERLKNLYAEITLHENAAEADLNMIQSDLFEKNAIRRAYLCDYSIFQHLYKIQARACARSGMSIFLLLLTIKQHKKDAPDTKKIAAGMEKMENVIATSLRSSDVFARYSLNQFITMLPSACYENSIMIGERILKNFDKTKPKTDLDVSYAVRLLEPQTFDEQE